MFVIVGTSCIHKVVEVKLVKSAGIWHQILSLQERFLEWMALIKKSNFSTGGVMNKHENA